MAVRDVAHCFVFEDHGLLLMHGVFHDVLTRGERVRGMEGVVVVHLVEMHSNVDFVGWLLLRLLLLDRDVLPVETEAYILVNVRIQRLLVLLMCASTILATVNM
jgi:hypothetical protein